MWYTLYFGDILNKRLGTNLVTLSIKCYSYCVKLNRSRDRSCDELYYQLINILNLVMIHHKHNSELFDQQFSSSSVKQAHAHCMYKCIKSDSHTFVHAHCMYKCIRVTFKWLLVFENVLIIYLFTYIYLFPGSYWTLNLICQLSPIWKMVLTIIHQYWCCLVLRGGRVNHHFFK